MRAPVGAAAGVMHTTRVLMRLRFLCDFSKASRVLHDVCAHAKVTYLISSTSTCTHASLTQNRALETHYLLPTAKITVNT